MPARYDDQLTIYTKMIEYSNIRVRFTSEIRQNPQAEESSSPLRSGSEPADWSQEESYWSVVKLDMSGLIELGEPCVLIKWHRICISYITGNNCINDVIQRVL